jgi:AraC family ethanolamine operon transcriptional activator
MARSFETTDFEEFDAVVAHWNLRTSFLDRGPFRGGGRQIGTAQAAISYGWFRGAVRQQGDPPEGMRTLLLTARPGQHFHWRGALVSDRDLVVHPDGGEVDGHTSSCLDVLTISLHPDTLQRVAESAQLDLAGSALGHDGTVRVDPRALQRLRRAALSAVNEGARDPSALARPHLQQELVESIPERVLEALGDSTCVERRNRRTELFLAAVRLLERSGNEPRGVAELSAVLGTSERTLRRAFVEHCDVSPQRYDLRRRLHRVRRELLRRPQTGVTDVANDHGFWHMGDFASHYLSAFGERPSETRDRAMRRR